MHFCSKLLLLSFLLLFIFSSVVAYATSQPIVYIVEKGDTLWEIAKNFHISLSTLLSYNNLTEKSVLKIGMKLKIPKPPSIKYTVKSGDSLWKIAKNFNISLSDLLSANHLRENAIIKPGDILIIPGDSDEGMGGSWDENTNPKNNHFVYIVEKGDTLWSIARKYNVRVSTLASYNGISEHSVLPIGKKILVPSKSSYIPPKKTKTTKSVKTTPSKTISYTVKKGDTLWSIARKYNVRVSTLASYNGISNLNRLKIGQRLKIPQGSAKYKSSPKKVSYLYYTVKKGDTLWSISKRFNVSLRTIMGLNGLSEKSILRIGKTIKIPYNSSYSTGVVFLWPTRGRLTSPFGWRLLRGKRQYHTGIDIANRTGTPIYAAASGVVSFSGWIRGYGRVVIISHSYGYKTVYGHCSVLLVRTGQYVRQGQYIAKMGSTGYSTGPHLHFEIRKNGKPQNPLNYLR